MTTLQTYDEIARQLAPIAIEAGAFVMGLQAEHQATYTKADGTPTCMADTSSEALIVKRLRRLFPDTPIVSEERIQDADIRDTFFLVDPVDGTAEFISGGKEYCINIALVAAGRPVAAVIAAPALGRIWMAGETALETDMAMLNPRAIRTRPARTGELSALTSNRYGDAKTEACLATLAIHERRLVSSAIKFGLIASGKADIYVRYGRTMEWDTAAGDHILTRAGGVVLDRHGAHSSYGRRNGGYANGPFMALGDPSFAEKIAFSMHI